MNGKYNAVMLPVMQAGSYKSRVLRLKPLGYWMLNESSGTSAKDSSGNGYHGTYNGVTLGQPGIGDGRTSISTSTAGYVNVFSAGLAAAFSGAEGTFSVWAMVDNVSRWTDGLTHRLGYFAVNSTNRVHLYNATNVLTDAYVGDSGGSVFDTVVNSVRSTGWTLYTITWSKSGEALKLYVNGRFTKESLTLGVWQGALAQAYIGGLASSGCWYGTLAHAALWNRALSATEVQRLMFSPRKTKVWLYGDSKTIPAASLPDDTSKTYWEIPTRSGVGGATVATRAGTIAADLAAIRADESPDVVLFNLGANDVGAALVEATWKADFTTILQAMTARWPAVKVYAMRPWRRSYGANCDTLATWIGDLAALNPGKLYAGPDERVFLENGDNGVTYTTDGIHPNDLGYALTAAQWKASIGV